MQRIGDPARRHARLHAPAHYATTEKVDHCDQQVHTAFVGGDAVDAAAAHHVVLSHGAFLGGGGSVLRTVDKPSGFKLEPWRVFASFDQDVFCIAFASKF